MLQVVAFYLFSVTQAIPYCQTSMDLKKNTEGNDQLPPYGEEEASAYTIMLSWKPFKHQVSESSLSSL